MAKWLDKNLFWLQMVLLLVILICFSFGIRGKVNLAVAFSAAAFLAFANIASAKYKRINLVGAIIWTIWMAYISYLFFK